jgi:hypothetical protein
MGPVTILDMIPKACAPAWKGNIFKSELIAAKSLLSVLCSSANDSKQFKSITLPFELFQLLLTCCILLKVMGHQPSDQNEQGPFTKTESCSPAQRVLQENEVHKKINRSIPLLPIVCQRLPIMCGKAISLHSDKKVTNFLLTLAWSLMVFCIFAAIILITCYLHNYSLK